MAKITSIKVGKGVTVNLGNFESLRIDYSVEAELGPKEKEDEVAGRLSDWTDERLNGELADMGDVISTKSIFKTETKKRRKRGKR